MVVTGSDFVSNSVVNWNGSARATTFVGSTQLVATILASDIATAGTSTVTVVTPTPGGGTSSGISFTVNKQTPVITWANPTDITYGTALSSTQLNATTTVAGTYTYTPTLGTYLNAGTAQTISVHFVPTDSTNYNTVDQNVTINVNKANQNITWSNPANIIQGVALSATQLNATTTVSGPDIAGALTYNPISGTVLAVGTHTLSVTVASTTNYNEASANVSLNVIPGPATQANIVTDVTNKEVFGTVNVTITIKDANGNLVSDGTFATTSVDFGSLGGATVTTNGVISKTLTATNTGTSTISISDLTVTGTTQVTFVDTTAPVITITGSNPQTVLVFSSFTDSGATSNDNLDGNITSTIATSSTVNTNVVGSYSVTYDSTDAHGNHSQVVRTVNVVDQTYPVITIVGSNPVTIEAGTTYTDAGASSTDNYDGNITSSIATSSTVNTSILGTYSVTYTSTDSSGNATSTSRTVNVTDTTDPILTLLGDSPMTIKIGSTFVDPGATSTDSFDTNVDDSSIVSTSTVNTSVVGTYTVEYSVEDASGNQSTSTRTVNVIPLSTTSSLASLSASSGTMAPTFSSGTLDYAVLLPFGATTTPTVSFSTTDSFATTSITNAVDVTSATSSDRMTTIVVTAEDGVSTTTYTVLFSVASNPNTVASVGAIFAENRSGGGRGFIGNSLALLPNFNPLNITNSFGNNNTPILNQGNNNQNSNNGTITGSDSGNPSNNGTNNSNPSNNSNLVAAVGTLGLPGKIAGSAIFVTITGIMSLGFFRRWW